MIFSSLSVSEHTHAHTQEDTHKTTHTHTHTDTILVAEDDCKVLEPVSVVDTKNNNRNRTQAPAHNHKHKDMEETRCYYFSGRSSIKSSTVILEAESVPELFQ